MRSKLAILVTLMGAQSAFAAVQGDVSNFKSPRGITESCIAVTKLPMGKYSSKDAEKEKEFCSMDFYNNTLALCPKTWSTSPGTIIHDNKGTGKSSEAVEATSCGKSSPLDSVAKFKTTMNQAGTSGTYSWSSILYYHFSRVLDATVDIPVAVYRTIDKDAHYKRVSSKASPPSNAKMNIAGWGHMKNAEKNPTSLKPTADLFTSDLEQIYGVILKDKGERYGVEVNGTRASGWGKGQNMDIQKTPSFLALKSSKPMEDAIEEGITQAFKDSAMAKGFGSVRPSQTQMALWMKEMSEMVILDYIFSQQDRVGNIDYRWFWVYQDPSGKVNLQKADSEVGLLKKNSIKVPAELATMNPILVQKTSIGDNDAGGLANYANFTKTTGMLEGIRHINPDTYQRLYNLALDFEKQGPNYQVLANSFGLRADSFKQTIANTKLAATVLLKTCEAGQLRFDLVSYKAAYQKQFSEVPVKCRPN
ncbi:hypothetical protein [Bdellovibrio sp. HCB337]|uniref:hypothetical protein n=1 Tax=Bdellovibrio sp. HCB337 TaxID=3394358 RepID=UPI0039A66B31